jgi:hypothetical protein
MFDRMSRVPLARSRTLALTVPLVAAAAFFLAGCGPVATRSSTTTTTTTTVATHTPKGDVAIDIGMVRLFAPRAWILGTPDSICGESRTGPIRCGAPCAPDASDIVMVIKAPPILTCREPVAIRHYDSVWVLGSREKPGLRRLRIDGGTIVRSIPSLGVVLYGFGSTGESIVRAAGPSSFAAFLSARVPVAAPIGWRTDSVGPIAVSIPKSWPRRQLNARSWPVPGICNSPIFPHPIAYSGSPSDGGYPCPADDSRTFLYETAYPGDGIWLTIASGQQFQHPFIEESPPIGRVVTVRGLRVEVRLGLPRAGDGSDTVEFLVTVGRTTVAGILGLGLNPRVAEEILSSIRTRR